MDRRTSLKCLSVASIAGILTGHVGLSRSQARKMVFCGYGETTTGLWKPGAAIPFEKKTGVAIEFSEAPNPSAALIGSIGTGAVDLAISTYIDVPTLARAGAIETFDPSDFPELSKVPPRYRLLDAAGRVCGIGAYQTWYGIAYNKRFAKAEDFNSWLSLADPKWKGRVALNRPQWGAAYELTILAHALGGDERNVDKAVDLYRRIANNSLTAYTSTSHMQRLLTRGEVVAGPFYSKDIYEMNRQGNADVALVLPKESALSLPYAVVVSKGSKNVEDAKKFLRYLMSSDAVNSLAAIQPVLPMDPTIRLSASTSARIGGDSAEMLSRLYAPDWNVVEADWKRRTMIAEKIFAAHA